jgi:hypothetical protein
MNNIFGSFLDQVTEEQMNFAYLWQDTSSIHTKMNSVKILDCVQWMNNK